MSNQVASEMFVPFLDLKTQYAGLQDELVPEILQCLEQARYIDGAAVRQFEAAFAEYCETDYCVGLDSGTAALHLALLALEIGPGDEVIVPANTFIATAAAVAMTGATVVPAESSPETWLLEPSDVEAKITARTCAVIAVHLYGSPVDLDSISEICERKQLFLIEDAAQAQGARWRGRRIGSFGHVACFSFYPGKNLGAFGDAGAVTTGDSGLANRIRSLGNHGRAKSRYEHMMVGYNYRMDEIQAVVLNHKLQRLDAWNARRRALANAYRARLADLPIEFYQIEEYSEPVYHLMAVCCDENQELSCFLHDRNVDCGFHYPIPVHLQPAFQRLSIREGSLPVTERICRRTLSLPMFPEMTGDQLDYVCETIAQFYR